MAIQNTKQAMWIAEHFGDDTLNDIGNRGDFGADQAEQLLQGLASEVAWTRYADPWLNANQMREIRLGLEAGLDVSRYADPSYDWQQMRELRWGLKDKLDVSSFSNPDLDHDQMYEVRMAVKNGLDPALVRCLATCGRDWRMMAEYRLALEDGLGPRAHLLLDPLLSPEEAGLVRRALMGPADRDEACRYVNARFADRLRVGTLDPDSIKELVVAHFLDIEMPGWFGRDAPIDAECIHQLCLLVKVCDGSELKAYELLQPGAKPDLIEAIRRGYELGLVADEMRPYVSDEYTPEQMDVIFSGLAECREVSWYADPAFDANQMQEILMGLRRDQDVSDWARTDLSPAEMAAHRHWSADIPQGAKDAPEPSRGPRR